MSSLKREPSGDLPLDLAFPRLQMDKVTYFLQPLQGKSLLKFTTQDDEVSHPPWKGRGRGRGKGGGKKRNAEGGLKNKSGGKGSGKAPSELQDRQQAEAQHS